MTCAFDHSRNKANQDLGTVVLRRKSACSQRADDEECDECKKRSLRGSVHKKLLVGAVDDPLELEADRIADAFLRHTPTTAGDSPAGGKTKAPFSAAYPDGNAQSEIAEAGRGERLPRDLAEEFQSFSGRDLGHISCSEIDSFNHELGTANGYSHMSLPMLSNSTPRPPRAGRLTVLSLEGNLSRSQPVAVACATTTILRRDE
jgi:hypothetical protein